MTRRDLLRLSIGAAAGAAAYSKPAARLPLAFSTLGCPKWDWSTIVRNANTWGYAALELRGIQDQMDLPKCAEFSPTRIQATMQDLAATGL
ncbi:MAG: sugar phosphate isomerase/epimerase, partial [Acidobacteria bacterium]|nr:sugar phosphate isomerase/epimerase [Acidobacteriota bacterium]